nr:hypothetical protein [uncultured Butyrivibrio sp.]
MKIWNNPAIEEIKLSATEQSGGPFKEWDGEWNQDAEGNWYQLSKS